MLLSTFFPYIRPEVQGCPDAVLEAYVRLAAIEFFNTAQVIEVDLPAMDLVAGQGTYTLSTGSAETVVASVSQVWLSGSNLKFTPLAQMRQYTTHWPDDTGDAICFTQQSEDTITIYPKPTATVVGGIAVRACIRPSLTATTLVDWAGNKYVDSIVNGAKARLMAMQGVPWANLKGAQMYGELFSGSSIATAAAKSQTSAKGALNVVTPGAV